MHDVGLVMHVKVKIAGHVESGPNPGFCGKDLFSYPQIWDQIVLLLLLLFLPFFFLLFFLFLFLSLLPPLPPPFLPFSPPLLPPPLPPFSHVAQAGLESHM